MVETKKSLIQSIDVIVNNSINDNNVFRSLTKFYEEEYCDVGLHRVVNYVLDSFNEGYTKHESLMSGYLYISSGLEVVEKFKYSNFVNPYIDGEFLDGAFDD